MCTRQPYQVIDNQNIIHFKYVTSLDGRCCVVWSIVLPTQMDALCSYSVWYQVVAADYSSVLNRRAHDASSPWSFSNYWYHRYTFTILYAPPHTKHHTHKKKDKRIPSRDLLSFRLSPLVLRSFIFPFAKTIKDIHS